MNTSKIKTIVKAATGPQPLPRIVGAGTSQLMPETAIVFNTYGRDAVAKRSLLSLINSLGDARSKIKIVVSDASPEPSKAQDCMKIGADDIVWTPTFVSAATQRNICVSLIQDKYSPVFICFLEDDYEYKPSWYPALVEACRRLSGVVSPFGIPYGMFSATKHPLEPERCHQDQKNGVSAYIFGAIADQRFMYFSHYLSVVRFWDPDLLGVSYCQTGMQTARNLMRGFCGGILDGDHCAEIPEQVSTWRNKNRYVGPPAHALDPSAYDGIVKAAQKRGTY